MIVCTQLNGFQSCYVTLTVQFWYTSKEFPVLLFNTDNSIQHYSFVSTQLNGQTALFQSILFNVSHFLYTV